MSSYGWRITYDHLDHKQDDTTGPRNISPAQEELLEAARKAGHQQADKIPAGVRWFKMYDDDGEIYYTGVYVGPDDERLFGPLDDYGTPNAGAVEIRYLKPETMTWETL